MMKINSKKNGRRPRDETIVQKNPNPFDSFVLSNNDGVKYQIDFFIELNRIVVFESRSTVSVSTSQASVNSESTSSSSSSITTPPPQPTSKTQSRRHTHATDFNHRSNTLSSRSQIETLFALYGVASTYITFINLNKDQMDNYDDYHSYFAKLYYYNQNFKYPLIFVNKFFFGSYEEVNCAHMEGFLLEMLCNVGLFGKGNPSRKYRQRQNQHQNRSKSQSTANLNSAPTVDYDCQDFDDDDNDDDDDEEFSIGMGVGGQMKCDLSPIEKRSDAFLMTKTLRQHSNTKASATRTSSSSMGDEDDDDQMNDIVESVQVQTSHLVDFSFQQHASSVKDATEKATAGNVLVKSHEFIGVGGGINTLNNFIKSTNVPEADKEGAVVEVMIGSSNVISDNGNLSNKYPTPPSQVLATINKWLTKREQIIAIRNKEIIQRKRVPVN